MAVKTCWPGPRQPSASWTIRGAWSSSYRRATGVTVVGATVGSALLSVVGAAATLGSTVTWRAVQAPSPRAS